MMAALLHTQPAQRYGLLQPGTELPEPRFTTGTSWFHQRVPRQRERERERVADAPFHVQKATHLCLSLRLGSNKEDQINIEQVLYSSQLISKRRWLQFCRTPGATLDLGLQVGCSSNHSRWWDVKRKRMGDVQSFDPCPPRSIRRSMEERYFQQFSILAVTDGDFCERCVR